MSWLYGNFHFFLYFYPKLGAKAAFLADEAACLPHAFFETPSD